MMVLTFVVTLSSLVRPALLMAIPPAGEVAIFQKFFRAAPDLFRPESVPAFVWFLLESDLIWFVFGSIFDGLVVKNVNYP